MIPSSADLTYFSEAAAQLNLSAAAKKLGISQPSLTLAIQRLEEAVGTPLLIRHKRGVTLTKAGQKLLAHTRELQDQWHKIKANTLASANEIQGTVNIGSHPSVGLYALSRFLPPLLAKYPDLNVQLKHDLSRRITDAVVDLTIDIGLVVNPVKHPDLIIKHLSNDKIMLWQSKQPTPMQDLASGQAIILCEPQLAQTQSILKNMKKAGIEYGRLVPASSLEVIADLTKHGCGIGILPGNIARLYDLEPIADTPSHEDEICLLYRGENRDVRVIQVIVEAIKAAFQ